jgi:hypothetical protein
MMKLLKNAPWKRTEIPESQWSEVLDSFKHKKCWQVKNYLGSMFFMDFGEEITFMTHDGSLGKAGASTLSVRDCYWELRVAGKTAITSDSISNEKEESLDSFLMNELMHDVQKSSDKENLILSFGQKTQICIDLTNKYCTEDAVVQIILKNGKIFDIDKEAKMYLSNKVSAIRYIDGIE